MIVELERVPMPKQIAALSRDDRGYPIPFFCGEVDGKPIIAAADPRKLTRCIQESLCWICGGKMTGRMAFVNGPQGIKNRISSDAPSHVVCARYAVRVCPFLTRKGMRRNAKLDELGTYSNPGAIFDQPPVCGVYVTDGYQIEWHGSSRLFRANAPLNIEWFHFGESVASREARSIYDKWLRAKEKAAT